MEKDNTPYFLYDQSENLVNGLFAVNDLSKGLNLSISTEGYLKDYKTVLDNNDSFLNSAISPSGNFIFNDKDLSKFAYSNAPISSVIADIGLLNSNTNRLWEDGAISESQFLTTQKFSGLCVDIIGEQQKYYSIGASPTYYTNFSDESNKLVNYGLDTIVRSIPYYPTGLEIPSLDKIREIGEIKEVELFESQNKLDIFLEKIDPQLISFRKGCWDTFNRKDFDYIGQSSSSMRRLVEHLIRSLAPEIEVIETEFFKNSPKGKDKNGKPTRQAKIMFILKKNNDSNHLERMVSGFLGAYDNLTAWDHIPLNEHNFVYGAFITIEGYLIQILSQLELTS